MSYNMRFSLYKATIIINREIQAEEQHNVQSYLGHLIV